tara:strand:- start:1282 stop:1482 length:201 start_codon:yes stop_codon:yes gene_type:complete
MSLIEGTGFGQHRGASRIPCGTLAIVEVSVSRICMPEPAKNGSQHCVKGIRLQRFVMLVKLAANAY